MLTARQRGQRRRREREDATGKRPQRPRLAEHALRTWLEEWARPPWSAYVDPDHRAPLGALLANAAVAGFQGTRRATLAQRVTRILEQEETTT